MYLSWHDLTLDEQQEALIEAQLYVEQCFVIFNDHYSRLNSSTWALGARRLNCRLKMAEHCRYRRWDTLAGWEMVLFEQVNWFRDHLCNLPDWPSL